MQIIKTLFRILILSSSTFLCFAQPPFQVLRTCMDMEPFEHMSTIEEIEGDGYAEKSLEGCKDQYDRTIDGHIYGTVECNHKFYLIIRDKKIDPEKATDYSINPEIKPGVEFTTGAVWYKIGFDKKEYLCIYAPLSEQGIGAAHNQYYIIENAFAESPAPKVYYYFEDKNIAPITSKTL